MKCRWLTALVLLTAMAMVPAADAQQQRLIVRDQFGVVHLGLLCAVVGCNVGLNLGDPVKQVFLVTPKQGIGLNALLGALLTQLGILDAEVDQTINLLSPTLAGIPNGLYDTFPDYYYGSYVWNGYVNQPASSIVHVAQTHKTFNVSGSGTVAVIDTGLDPRHPALAKVALPGYDFTRNSAGADETGDLDHSTAGVLDGGPGVALYVDPWLAAVVPPAGALALSNPAYAAFGHGTMTAGLVHLVAPTASILPLKAFGANGTGYASDVVRALYYAAAQGANVVSMSFSFNSMPSTEMLKAVNYVTAQGLTCVAAAGNDGKKISVYPASYSGVIGVASTSNNDTRSSFSNYGSQVVWVAAPGEAVVSSFPFATYASASGTSFSTPLVSGTVALLNNFQKGLTPTAVKTAIGDALYLNQDLNRGRLDTTLALGSLGH
jgi:thermitase